MIYYGNKWNFAKDLVCFIDFTIKYLPQKIYSLKSTMEINDWIQIDKKIFSEYKYTGKNILRKINITVEKVFMCTLNIKFHTRI